MLRVRQTTLTPKYGVSVFKWIIGLLFVLPNNGTDDDKIEEPVFNLTPQS